MLDSKPVSTPIAGHFKLSITHSPQTEDEIKDMSRIPYSNAIGSLMYDMVCTRPDLAYSASIVSRFMANPGKQHWSVVKWILRYLKGSKSVGLVYEESQKESMVCQAMLMLIMQVTLTKEGP